MRHAPYRKPRRFDAARQRLYGQAAKSPRLNTRRGADRSDGHCAVGERLLLIPSQRQTGHSAALCIVTCSVYSAENLCLLNRKVLYVLLLWQFIELSSNYVGNNNQTVVTGTQSENSTDHVLKFLFKLWKILCF
jgi:hypothetical protein